MSTRPPPSRVELIRRSLRCFVFGLVGLLPVIGIPLAVAALVEFYRVRSGAGSEWNPAAGYLRAGHNLAVLALLVTALLVSVVVVGWGATVLSPAQCGR